MILIGVGANLPLTENNPPRSTCGAALVLLTGSGVTVLNRSPWYKSAPVPMSDAPWYVNGVIEVETSMPPKELLELLHNIEGKLGRNRPFINAPRTLDLDILTYNNKIIPSKTDMDTSLVLPHPRLHQRAFVLFPLRDLYPDWMHPVSNKPIDCLINLISADQKINKMTDAPGDYGTEWNTA